MDFDQPPVVRVFVEDPPPPGGWPMTVPSVAQLAREGLDPPPEGGSTQGAHSTRPTESDLARHLTLRRGIGSSRWGFFLRAETLGLMSVLDRLTRSGGQVLCATHSPVPAALPGATILEVGDWGYRPARWEDLELVQHWRAYLDAPQRYLRHLLGDD